MKTRNLWEVSVKGQCLTHTYYPHRFLQSQRFRDYLNTVQQSGNIAFVRCIKGAKYGEGYNVG
jgi:hypothetical protein